MENANYKNRLRFTSSDLIGDSNDKYFFTCGLEGDYKIIYNQSVSSGNISVFKSDKNCVFINLYINGSLSL